jgi:two-component system LytT family response regulator
MNGLDVLQAIESEAWPLIVFVTAYDKYAVQAFEVHAMDYLLKPFDEERFRKTLGRVRHSLEGGSSQEQKTVETILRLVAGGRHYLQRVGVKSGGRVIFLKTTDVDWFEATGNYITLHVGKESLLIRESMNDLEPKLDPDQFVRVQRSAIVNLDLIKELQPWFHGQQVLVLKDGRQVTVGRTYRNRLQRLLENKVAL